jgi:hypothetical protein
MGYSKSDKNDKLRFDRFIWDKEEAKCMVNKNKFFEIYYSGNKKIAPRTSKKVGLISGVQKSHPQFKKNIQFPSQKSNVNSSLEHRNLVSIRGGDVTNCNLDDMRSVSKNKDEYLANLNYKIDEYNVLTNPDDYIDELRNSLLNLNENCRNTEYVIDISNDHIFRYKNMYETAIRIYTTNFYSKIKKFIAKYYTNGIDYQRLLDYVAENRYYYRLIDTILKLETHIAAINRTTFAINLTYSIHHDYKKIIDILDKSFSDENRTHSYFKFKNNMGKLFRGWKDEFSPDMEAAITNFIYNRDMNPIHPRDTVIYNTCFSSWSINLSVSLRFGRTNGSDTVNLFICNNIDEGVTSMCASISAFSFEKEILVNRNVKLNVVDYLEITNNESIYHVMELLYGFENNRINVEECQREGIPNVIDVYNAGNSHNSHNYRTILEECINSGDVNKIKIIVVDITKALEGDLAETMVDVTALRQGGRSIGGKYKKTNKYKNKRNMKKYRTIKNKRRSKKYKKKKTKRKSYKLHN